MKRKGSVSAGIFLMIKTLFVVLDWHETEIEKCKAHVKLHCIDKYRR